MNAQTPKPYFEYVKGEPRRDSQRPRDPKPGVTPEQVAHAEFILSTRETRLTLEG